MSRQDISADGGSNIAAAGRDLQTITNVNINNLQLVVHQSANAAIEQLPAIVRSEGQRSADDLSDAIIEAVQEYAPEAAESFNSPRVLGPLQRAHQACIEAEGDEALTQRLAAMLVELARADRRTIRERAIRAALDCLPRLSDEHVNALAVSCILNLRWNGIDGVSQLADLLNLSLKPFYGSTPMTTSEYQYMASTGVGSVVGLGISPFQSIADEYGYEIQKYAPREELLQGDASNADLLETDPHNPDMARLTREGYKKGDDYVGGTSAPRIARLTKTKADAFEDAVLLQHPELHQFLSHLKEVRALDFSSNAAGRAIAVLTWQRAAPGTAISLDELLSF